MAYEKANEKSGRLFLTTQEKLAANPKLPAINGTIMVDGIVLYLGLWKRQAKNGNEYFTAELTYPNDEKARLCANGKSTSEASAREREYDKAHPQVKKDQQRKWEARPQNKQEPQGDGDPDDMPF